MLERMCETRYFEEKAEELYTRGLVHGTMHLSIGMEASPIGSIAALEPDDLIIHHHRGHGHTIAKGADITIMFAEFLGKEPGYCRGRGGSMHLFDAQTRFFGGNAIVGGGLPLAVGFALADKLQSKQRVTACFFGEGAMAEGAFHESMNLAALWQLPALFCCENNQYAMGTALGRSEAQTDLCAKAASYAVPTLKADGMDIVAVHEAMKLAVRHVRDGLGPFFLELQTYRFRAHSMFDPELYRDKAEVEQWKQRGPLHTFSARLKAEGKLTEAEFLALGAQANAEVQASVDFAEAAEWEPVADLLKDVHTP